MADEVELNGTHKKEDEIAVRPILFIGLGGTGMEILQRVRQRILGAVWGGASNPVRVSSLAEFPVAQFLYVDLDSVGTNLAGNMAAGQNVFATQVKFTDEEKIMHPLDSNKYFASDGELTQYPHIQNWMPLTRKKFLDLGINPLDGAGQTRSLSRLYFFDKYRIIRDSIRSKITSLKNGVSSERQRNRLGLELDQGMRVVVVSSSAGGTGSGSFLDMGYLAQIMVDEIGPKNRVDLILLLPGAYAAYGKDRTEANGYAALMELETLMSRDVKFVEYWERDVKFTPPMKPYSDVFLCDTTNVAGEGTSSVSDIYDMVADILFEDFTSEKFGKRKRSIAPNQSATQKSGHFSPPLGGQYKKLDLYYSRAFSAFGQFTIDTQLELKKNAVLARHVNDMLKVFFGIAGDDTTQNTPTKDERDALLTEHMFLGQNTYTLKYKYAGEATPGFEEETEKLVPKLVDELLRVQNKSLVDSVTATVHSRVDEIKNAGDKDQWAEKITSLKKQLERDAFKNVDVGSGIQEDNLVQRRAELFAQLTGEKSDLVTALWERVDNNERGGIDYTIELIDHVKKQIENTETGLIRQIQTTAKWFEDLSGHIKAEEIKVLEEHLSQVKGKGLFSFGKESQAEAKIGQLSEALALWITFHLQAVACREAEALLRDLSDWLGKKSGTDSNGEPIWKGFVGKLQEGRALVRSVMAEMNQEIAATEQAMKSAHATYEVIPPAVAISDQKVSPEQAKSWAKETFDNYGGKRELFKRLESPASRAVLVGELRNVALRKLPEDSKDKENPLFEALRLYERQHGDIAGLFEKCLKRAMPWADANLSGQFTSNKDNYSIIIGVAKAAEFEKEFGDKFRKAIPTQTGITADKINKDFLESGIPGKLTCYIEFSGLPLTALRQLRNWRASYYREGKTKSPVHTHRDKTLFVHPVAPTSDELDQLAKDYQLFLQAIMLGVLKSRADTNEYEIKKRGNRFSIGCERTIRMEGVVIDHHRDIEEQLANALGKARSPYQLAALASLYDYYAQEVFKPRMEKEESGPERLSENIGYTLCQKLQNDMLKEFEAKAKAQKLDGPAILEHINEDLDAWTEIIRSSENDGYLHEVHEDRKAKRVVKPEFFEPGWLEGILSAVPPPPVPGTKVIPPGGSPPPGFRPYKVEINGKSSGPYDWIALYALANKGELNTTTRVWRKPMAAWQSAGEIQELEPLLSFEEPELIDDDEPPL